MSDCITDIDIHTTGQPFADGNEVWAHVGWIDPDTQNVYGLSVPGEHRDRVMRLQALYITLGSRVAD